MTFLLVSDLDGTLLTSAKAVGQRTVGVLNRFIAAGGLFSVATARMAYGCDRLLAAVDLDLPGIVMNGAAMYDFRTGTYQDVRPMPAEAVGAAAAEVARAGVGAFVYGVRDGRMRLGYTRADDLAWTQYNSARAQETLSELECVGPDNWQRLGDIIYLAVVGDDAGLARTTGGLDDVAGLVAHPYRNIYTGHDCLEYSSPEAGKEAAVLRLKERIGADRLVVFGDNRNDLGMMRLADHSLAPATSVPEALAIADEVIASNDEDGVGRAIEAHWDGWTAGVVGRIDD
jgi:Cof subfamily protein (haloacid dehalogenase superfamily)